MNYENFIKNPIRIAEEISQKLAISTKDKCTLKKEQLKFSRRRMIPDKDFDKLIYYIEKYYGSENVKKL